MKDDDEEEENTFGVTRYPCMPSLVALQQMRNRLHLAFLGRKLMKWTMLASGRELRRLAIELDGVYKGFAEELRNAYIQLARSRYYHANLNEMVLEDIPKKAGAIVIPSTKSVSGVKLWQYVLEETEYKPYVHLGIGKGGQTILETKKAWLELLKHLITMMTLRTSFRMVEISNRAATKKFNVLSKLVIPRVNLSQRYIISELEEMEREDNFRLKRFKELKLKKAGDKTEKKDKPYPECPICKKSSLAELKNEDSPISLRSVATYKNPIEIDKDHFSISNVYSPVIERPISENKPKNSPLPTEIDEAYSGGFGEVTNKDEPVLECPICERSSSIQTKIDEVHLNSFDGVSIKSLGNSADQSLDNIRSITKVQTLPKKSSTTSNEKDLISLKKRFQKFQEGTISLSSSCDLCDESLAQIETASEDICCASCDSFKNESEVKEDKQENVKQTSSNVSKPTSVDSSIGYFEKKIRRIKRITRTQNADGTIREEKETIITRKSKRIPNEISMLDDEDTEDISDDDDDDEKQVNICTIKCNKLYLNSHALTKSELAFKTPISATSNMRKSISLDNLFFGDDNKYSTESISGSHDSKETYIHI
ncbi:uncharacterized protein LOC126971319 isoform X10 [Leptidea sinapis]|uniref:uncharacterized protein LOC126971319 isoform X10 n=1 Tax=Leptidea sinapis TaxID=189913 RepID=UPI0021C470A7|nr:uncharacterized protein LOC126971319 isoform X10 [Leptidea sinapis]